MTTEDGSPVPDYQSLLRLDGRVFIVVGAGRGNGRQTAHALTGAGAQVVCVDVDETRAREVAAETGGEPCVVNAATRDGAEQYVSTALDKFGRLDGVADIVGMAAWAPVLEMTDDDWAWSFDMCLRHAVLAVQVAGRVLAEGDGGSLVFIASISGVSSAPRHSAYGAFKAGLLSLVRTAADELAPRNVRVNAVTPGGIATPRLLSSTPEADRPPIGKLGGLARTSDIAAAILFLSSDMARMITGQSLVVDGGGARALPVLDGAADADDDDGGAAGLNRPSPTAWPVPRRRSGGSPRSPHATSATA
ncbi:MAG TPA: SDR family oxidoreductase [Acidimicrobiales bacterium]|nr:SDR family oxidoreductase [Acidimicrobiales bacterium]